MRSPVGWAELEAHLVDDHDLNADEVEALDADAAREWHRMLHKAARFAPGSYHDHNDE